MPDFEMRTPQDRTPGDHISEGELAALLDGALDPADRSRVEAHLEGCAECRGELIEMRRITNGYTKHGRSRGSGLRRWWIPAIAAAGLAALVLGTRLIAPAPHGESVRSGAPVGDGEGRARIDIVAPAENATVAPYRITFRWHSTTADLYSISLLTESGEPVWSAETSDTTSPLPDSVSLRGGQPYFWRVEAITNGITATTGVHRIQIAP